MSESPLNTLLNDNRIRKIFNEGEWYYSVIDLVMMVSDLPLKDAQNHSFYLKKRLRKEMADNSFNYKKLRLVSRDGKKYMTEVVDTEQALRLIQSIASPTVEPVKRWLAQLGKKHFEDTIEQN
jgi:hypothetical protein